MQRRYLTLDEAAGLLGWVGAGRGTRLLRVLRAKERRLGRPIAARLGGQGRGVRYRLTEGVLRRHCAELFIASQDELVAEVRRHLDAMEARIEATVDERTAPQFESMRRSVARLEAELGKLRQMIEARGYVRAA